MRGFNLQNYPDHDHRVGHDIAIHEPVDLPAKRVHRPQCERRGTVQGTCCKVAKSCAKTQRNLLKLEIQCTAGPDDMQTPLCTALDLFAGQGITRLH